MADPTELDVHASLAVPVGREDLLALVDERLLPEPRRNSESGPTSRIGSCPDAQTAVMSFIIPPKRPLSFDILLHLVGFLWQPSDIPTLNIIRLTTRAADQVVEKQVVYAHNHVLIDDHYRLAKLCAVVLRRPAALIPLLRSINIGRIHQKLHEWDEERDVWTPHPCICTSLLADVLEQSRALEHVEIANGELVFAGDARLRKALSKSLSLRQLRIHGDVGPHTRTMLRRMTSSVRELELNLYDNSDRDEDTAPFMVSLRGLSTSLEKLTLSWGRSPLAIDTSRPDLVWPRVHTVELHSVEAESTKLFHAFPNLRTLWFGEREFYFEPETTRAAARLAGRCWPSLDDARLSVADISALGLTCLIRRLTITSPLVSDAKASFIIADLPILQPVVLALSMRMVPAQRCVGEFGLRGNHARGLTPSVAGQILRDLPRLKTLKLSISGERHEQTIQSVDEYMEALILGLNAPLLEFLHLTLCMFGLDAAAPPINGTDDERQMQSIHKTRIPRAFSLSDQLHERMSDAGLRALLEAVLKNAPSLRYVFILGWYGNSQYWEIGTRAPSESTAAVELRKMDEQEGFQLWEQYDQADI